jgi:hypothetical protein
MPVFETYAERVARATKAGTHDPYTYDELPPFLREQISQIFTHCIGPGWQPVPTYGEPPRNANEVWERVAGIMGREVKSFVDFGRNNTVGSYAYHHCMEYLRRSRDIEGVLSLIEVCARAMVDLAKNGPGAQRRYSHGSTERPDLGLAELNERLLRAGVGYQFENGHIIRVDSQYVHAEVVKEALRLLHEPSFEKANEEFMTAHRHLREGKLRDCNTAALRSMENVLKVICDARGWIYQKVDTVERLLAIVRREGLFPDYLGGYFDNLIGAMKAGLPKIRDRQGGHGAAPGDDPVPDYVSAFALHLAATNIVMLVKAYQSLPPPSPIAGAGKTK